jgi:hypothetical protein
MPVPALPVGLAEVSVPTTPHFTFPSALSRCLYFLLDIVVKNIPVVDTVLCHPNVPAGVKK